MYMYMYMSDVFFIPAYPNTDENLKPLQWNVTYLEYSQMVTCRPRISGCNGDWPLIDKVYTVLRRLVQSKRSRERHLAMSLYKLKASLWLVP